MQRVKQPVAPPVPGHQSPSDGTEIVHAAITIAEHADDTTRVDRYKLSCIAPNLSKTGIVERIDHFDALSVAVAALPGEPCRCARMTPPWR